MEAQLPVLKINPKFKNLLDDPTADEKAELAKQLIANGGPRDAIIIRKGTNEIVDGHNRYAICVANNLKFQTIEMEFADDAAVEEWMIHNQLARRNLSPDRAQYFIGILYNKSKQDPEKLRVATEDGKTTAEKIAEKHGVSEKTVRRAGEMAKGVDAIAETLGVQTVQEKLKAIKEKNLNAGELSTIGRVKDPKIQRKAAAILVKEKTEEARRKAREALRKPAAKASTKASKEVYDVVFAKPKFDKAGFNLRAEEKPKMAESCMAYIVAQDEDLGTALDLLKTWGLKYQASFIFKIDGHEGTLSDIQHMFLIAGGRGTLATPKKASPSIAPVDKNIGVEPSMLKLVGSYHPTAKLLDMRKK